MQIIQHENFGLGLTLFPLEFSTHFKILKSTLRKFPLNFVWKEFSRLIKFIWIFFTYQIFIVQSITKQETHLRTEDVFVMKE